LPATYGIYKCVLYIAFIGFGSQEGWITTDIKSYTANSKTVSTHQLSVLIDYLIDKACVSACDMKNQK